MTVPPRLQVALADRYRLERELGQGAMATVYLARDLKHDRQVALKILKPDLAAVLGAERFVLEIRTTAALQHPHILPLFDSGEADGFLYYVMPFVDGETLRSRLDRETQLGVEDAVRIARDIADALHYAHTRGVIHRDIKPENILLHDGRPLIADFGIALAIRESGGTRLTSTGLSVGTPSYMSPEQAMGDHRIDARSDIYSLGTMLYEMLAGAPPFTGSTAQAIVARILTETPPPITRARSSVPAHVAAAIHTTLERLPADRFASAAAFGAALANPSYTVPGFVGEARAAAGPHTSWSPRSVAVAGVALVATLAAAWLATRPTPEIPVRRLSLFLPAAEQLGRVGFSRLALAPDGSAFAYAGQDAAGTQRLMLRFFGEFGAVPLPGTETGVSPSFSPDGSRIVFLTRAPFTIKVVDVNGAPATILEDQNVLGGGVAWSADDWIYFDTGNTLDRIRPDGGPRETVVALDSTVEEVGFAWPEPLPNGRGLIYRSRRAGEPRQSYVLRVVDLRTLEARTLVQGLVGRYSPTGHLLYVRADGVLIAAPFDQDRMELTGPPTPLIEGLDIVGFGAADVVLSPSGDLLFVRSFAGGGARPSWVKRDGSAELVDPAWGAGSESISDWALSPDGRRLAVAFRGTSRQGSPGDIWVKELDDGPMSRLTFEGINGAPAWTADGRAIIY
ncbi:MAG TPA: protein kinase, partial [Longimicrobiales bacterium]|nr:protein kinase [Longimicrobiales bacterium]